MSPLLKARKHLIQGLLSFMVVITARSMWNITMISITFSLYIFTLKEVSIHLMSETSFKVKIYNENSIAQKFGKM